MKRTITVLFGKIIFCIELHRTVSKFQTLFCYLTKSLGTIPLDRDSSFFCECSQVQLFDYVRRLKKPKNLTAFRTRKSERCFICPVQRKESHPRCIQKYLFLHKLNTATMQAGNYCSINLELVRIFIFFRAVENLLLTEKTHMESFQ